jgi:organic hydroperoxide reductase OsmC/OhrA
MSEHLVKINWERNSVPFEYETYPRDHTWTFEGGVEVSASAAPDYKGSDQRVDPEEAFVAALSSCHMLTFLAIAAKKRIAVEEYSDHAIGYLEKNESGKISVTRVLLRPTVAFSENSAQSPEQLAKLHHSAHENCFIANSVNTVVTVEA